MYKHIEFIGLPGSGKSTLMEEAVNILFSKKYQILDRKKALYSSYQRSFKNIPLKYLQRLLPHFVQNIIYPPILSRSKMRYESLQRFIRDNLKHVEIVVTSINTLNNNIHEKDRYLWWYINLFTHYQIIYEYFQCNEIVLFDEGFVHRWGALLGAEKGDEIKKSTEAYLCTLPQLFCLVYIETSEYQCIERMKIRGYPLLMKGKSEAEILKILKNTKNHYDSIMSYMKEKVPVIHIDNNVNFNVSQKSLVNKLSGILGKGNVE